jgi:hypothetical protein
MKPAATKQFNLTKDGTTYVIDDQLKINKKEMLLYPLPMFIFISLVLIGLYGSDILIGILLSALLSFLFGVLYILFRFSAWLFYQEIKIDPDKRILMVTKKILNFYESTKFSISNYDPDRILFTEYNRGGHKKFILQYRNHKILDLLVVNSEDNKNDIERFLNLKKTGYNKQ